MPPRSFIFRLLAEGISPSDVSSANADIAFGTYTSYGTKRLPVFVKLALGLSPSDSAWFTLTQSGAAKSEDETSWCIVKDDHQGQDSQSAARASMAGVRAHQV